MIEYKTGVFNILNNNPIYIIGDIHGDYQCLIHCLVDLCGVANIINVAPDVQFNESSREYLEWKEGNNSIIVFCGDLIHRKRFKDSVLDDECSDIFIIKTLFKLKKTAKKNGGDVLIISGNHEIMNIVDPSDTTYTSDKNMQSNFKYFSNKNFVNDYVSNTYAWIKINDILIAHGGLCSDYLNFLNDEKIFDKNIFGKKISNDNANSSIMIGGDIIKTGNDVVDFINNKYRDFFTNYNKEKSNLDHVGFKLFVEYDFSNKHSHNIFWCREWGYSGINCDDFNKLINKVDCNKMIVAHCPQFLANDKPKMINFECEYDYDEKKYNDFNGHEQKFKIARVDLGMSRSFEYNKKSNDFFKFLKYNYNRKMSVLKLQFDLDKKNYYFNYNSVVTNKLSCIQYLLIKYGINKKDWIDKKIYSNWLGFEYIENLLNDVNTYKKNIINNNYDDNCNLEQIEPNKIMMCLLYPVLNSKLNLKSTTQFNKFTKFDKLIKSTKLKRL